MRRRCLLLRLSARKQSAEIHPKRPSCLRPIPSARQRFMMLVSRRNKHLNSCGLGRAEAGSEFTRADTDAPAEVVPQCVGPTQSDSNRDLVHAQMTRSEQALGLLDPLRREPLASGDPVASVKRLTNVRRLMRHSSAMRVSGHDPPIRLASGRARALPRSCAAPAPVAPETAPAHPCEGGHHERRATEFAASGPKSLAHDLNQQIEPRRTPGRGEDASVRPIKRSMIDPDCG